MRIVDLRSDTVTKPPPSMWEAVKGLENSDLGDDVMREDPTVNQLERKAAGMMGKEAALFVTSGTQGNLVSLLSHTSPGDEILVEEISHVYSYEVGGAARIGGLMVRTFPSERGVPDLEHLQGLVRNKMDIHQPPTTLLTVENTHNYHGGVVITPEQLRRLKEFVEKNKMKLHMDGARFFNAVVATGKNPKDFTAHVDSVMFCLSKGLSCPIGSIVAGKRDFIERARKYRKMLGGGWRQAGILAAMGLVALEEQWINRLADDHHNAKLLADGIRQCEMPLSIIEPETNILIVKFPKEISTARINTALKKKGILAFNKNDFIRFVTHYGVTEDDIQHAAAKIKEVLTPFHS